MMFTLSPKVLIHVDIVDIPFDLNGGQEYEPQIITFGLSFAIMS